LSGAGDNIALSDELVGINRNLKMRDHAARDSIPPFARRGVVRVTG
jgi:hypothetical protein